MSEYHSLNYIKIKEPTNGEVEEKIRTMMNRFRSIKSKNHMLFVLMTFFEMQNGKKEFWVRYKKNGSITIRPVNE